MIIRWRFGIFYILKYLMIKININMVIERLATDIKTEMWNASVKFVQLRNGSRNADPYVSRVHALHRMLRIPADYNQRGLRFHREATDLVAVPCGNNGRDRLMSSSIQPQWLAMQAAATSEGFNFFVKHAFRSVDLQALLIRQQLSGGYRIDELLNWIAAPGYSEHHTGRALDLACVSCDDNDFDKTPAFYWLCENAAKFGFKLSYLKNNSFGIKYEPWHWYCSADIQKDVR